MARQTDDTLPTEAPRTLLGAADILRHKELPTDYVDVPEWGGTVKVRGLSGTERDRYEQGFVQFQGNTRIVTMENARARLVALCVVDETGKRLFTDSQVQELGALSGAALDRVFDKAQELSGLGERQLKEMVTVLGNGLKGGGGSA